MKEGLRVAGKKSSWKIIESNHKRKQWQRILNWKKRVVRKVCRREFCTELSPHVDVKLFVRLIVNPSINHHKIRNKTWNVAFKNSWVSLQHMFVHHVDWVMMWNDWKYTWDNWRVNRIVKNTSAVNPSEKDGNRLKKYIQRNLNLIFVTGMDFYLNI